MAAAHIGTATVRERSASINADLAHYWGIDFRADSY